jgi:cytochrome c biogenesis protein
MNSKLAGAEAQTSGEGDHAGRTWLELLSSMRFAIALLTIICIASVIGTVLKQHEPAVNYVNQFGPFWADVFRAFKLNAVYSAWWFLLILAFLVLSTSLCIARNTPKILRDLKTYKESIRVQGLRAFHHKAQALWPVTAQEAAQRIGQDLVRQGWKVRLQERPPTGAVPGGWMIAAKAGAANKLGYIAAHSAIVLVCIGGLLDGDLFVRAQTWFGGKETYSGGGLISDVPAQHRLSERNPAFRGNLLVAEGTASSTAILNQSEGILLQDLPFTIELQKFIVEYYSTGMPKLFASDIVIHDKETGEKKAVRVEVNKPASHRGIEIYQSSFDDGGSRIKLKAYPMSATTRGFEIEGTVGSESPLTNGQDNLTLEYTGLRVINVEDLSQTRAAQQGLGEQAEVAVNMLGKIDQRLGAGHKTTTEKNLRNVGPSVSYKLRDAAGQAREYNNYMLPVDLGDGTPVFLLGMRETPAQAFRYLRPPADEMGSLNGFLRLRAALYDSDLRERAAKRYANRAVDPARQDLTGQLATSALRALTLFAGEGPTKTAPTATATPTQWAGLQGIADFIEANVPEAERERAGQMLVRILNGALYELDVVARQAQGVAPLPDDKVGPFMTQALLALSDAPAYTAPMVFLLQDFTHVQASVFQVARAPGKYLVYLGCFFLIVGIFAMLYVRERRMWIWLTPDAASSSQSNLLMAFSMNRRTRDGEQEFERWRAHLEGQHPNKEQNT